MTGDRDPTEVAGVEPASELPGKLPAALALGEAAIAAMPSAVPDASGFCKLAVDGDLAASLPTGRLRVSRP